MIRRLALLVLSAILASSAVFFMLRILPGDAALTLAGLEATAEEIEATRRQLGTDKPVVVQYFHWIWGMLHGDFGISYLNIH